jgi:hypothetical protein
MNDPEQSNAIAAKLVESRRTLRDFMGSGYPEYIAPWIDLIQRIMAAQKCTAMEAMHHALLSAKQHADDFGPAAMTLMAACVEVTEKSWKSTRPTNDAHLHH